MKWMCVLSCVFLLTGTALGQESEVTYENSTTTTVGGADLMSQLWQFEDATPLATGQLDLRLGFRWVTESGHANLGDSDDDFVLSPALVWGAAENLELSLVTDTWLGDSGDMGPFEDGNYDTTIGMLWRLHEQAAGDCAEGCLHLPSIAFSGSARIPTGCESDGVDGELRLVMTYEYDSGIRSHLNVFGKSVNGDNQEWIDSDALEIDVRDFNWFFTNNGGDIDPRHFQWGIVIGADGPLCADGAVRWAADYMHRSSEYYGRGDMDIFELGWEWEINEAHKFGTSVQIGLDHMDDNPNFGAAVAYAYSLTY